MLSIRLGRWDSHSGKKWVWTRLRLWGWVWTPFCNRKRRFPKCCEEIIRVLRGAVPDIPLSVRPFIHITLGEQPGEMVFVVPRDSGGVVEQVLGYLIESVMRHE